MSTNDGLVQTLASDVEIKPTKEYVTVTGLITGHNYKFSSTRTGNNDYITVTTTSNSVIAHGVSPLTINNIAISTIRIHVRVNSSCDTDDYFHVLTLVDLTVEPTTCQKPELGSLSISYKSNTRIDVYWNPPLLGSPPSGYDWEIVPDNNAPGVGTVASGFVSAPTTSFSSGDVLSPSTAYDIYLRSNCDGEGYGVGDYYLTASDNIPGFTTNSNPPPSNDLCGGALTIIEQTNIPNAAAATPTAGTLLGGAETDVNAEACGGITGNALDDVWYKFVAQTSNVHITVEPNPDFDVVITLYGGNCNSLSYLACSDSNFSDPSAEEINYTGLTIGQTYYTRTYYYYLYTPATPTFNIKIWTPSSATDADGDGYSNIVDCNDSNPAIHPGATEIAGNAIDENCDSQFGWYLDSDSDGYGSTTVVQSGSSSPGVGQSNSSTDCNDGDSAVYPNAPELCDGKDNDCDTVVDDGVGFTTYYRDVDNDTYGNASDSTSTCDGPPAGYVSNATDCDDGDSTVYPGAPELCDGKDNDCANGIDDGLAFVDYYIDADSDGHGDSSDAPESSCSPVSGKVTNNTDCNDGDALINPTTVWYLDADGDNYAVSTTAQCNSPGAGYTTTVLPLNDCNDGNATIHPGATDIVANGIDENCDGLFKWYQDNDGDGYGSTTVVQSANASPGSGESNNSLDCDDSDSTVYSGAPELCDGKDNDCANGIDDGLAFVDYYIDADSDGYGDSSGAPESSCSPVSGKVTNNTDCDDGDALISPTTIWYLDADGDDYAVSTMVQCTSPGSGYTTSTLPLTDCDDGDSAVYPSAPELCDGKDNDCDTVVDDGVSFTTYYRDLDGDTYGNASDTTSACDGLPAGYVSNATDCDDGDSTVYPGAPELCDGKDNDCDTTIDEGLSTDADADGHYALGSCATPADDCNDSDSTIYPGAPELCDGKDNDCDTVVDDGVSFTTYYRDVDNDTYGNASDSTSTCDGPPAGYVSNATDCNDGDSTIYPGAPELCDGKDNDCDTVVDDGVGFTTYYRDSDNDGYGNASDSTSTCDGPPAGYVANATDCNDGDSTIYPGAPELCDGKDNDCANGIDDGLSFVDYYIDADSDGYGDSSGGPESSCSPVSGKVTNNTDCDDGDALISPTTIWYLDADGDDYAVSTMVQCTSPGSGYTTSTLPLTDCDDGDSAVYPSAPELCDGKDNDCDTVVDDGVGFTTYYRDVDNDTYGNASDSTSTCDGPPAGYVANATDCNDGDSTIYPGAPELCDGKDNDCDTLTDDGVGFTAYYRDIDNDTYGDAGDSTSTCDGPPSGYVSNGTDCDDNDSTIYPGAPELCDGKDNDCANGIDDGLAFVDYYIDADSDGYGDSSGAPESSCSLVPGKVTNNTDCNDGDALIGPTTVWYLDADGDSYAVSTMIQCTSPGSGYTTNTLPLTDCDDGDSAVYPSAPELCDGKDNDCDTVVDDGVSFTTYYRDSDGDTYGNASDSTSTCDGPPAGYVANATDCDDSDGNEFPGQTWYADSDGDGYGDGTSSVACERPSGSYTVGELAATTGDCDDEDFGVNPGQTEIEANDKDDDCNPSTPDEPLGIEKLKWENIIIKPNPFNQSIMIGLPLSFDGDGFDIYLFDMNGRMIIKRNAISINGTMIINNLDRFDQGVYFVKISHNVDGRSFIKQLIKF